MKKNLLFALSVFLLTIASLLLFSQTSNNSKQETSQLENVEITKEPSNLVSLN